MAPHRVVIAGGGIAALEAAIALHTISAYRVAITLVSPNDSFFYRPLLVGEPFGLGKPNKYKLEEICDAHDVTFVNSSVIAVDVDDYRIKLSDGGELAYDTLIVAAGARMVPTFEFGVTFDLETAPEEFAELLEDLGEGLAPRIAIVVPESVHWTLPAYEIALMIAEWGKTHRDDQLSITLITHEAKPLGLFGALISEQVATLLDAAGITVQRALHSDMLSHTALRASGEWVSTDRVVALPHISGLGIPGLPCDQNGFIPVDDFGRVTGVADVYAAGDVTTSPIKQGGLAAQLADVASRHLAASLDVDRRQLPQRRFKPILRAVLQTADGPLYLRAELDSVDATSTITDQPLWWPPSKLSSRWLAPYLSLLESEQRLSEGLPPTRATASN